MDRQSIATSLGAVDVVVRPGDRDAVLFFPGGLGSCARSAAWR
jgi:hypothetical protein